MENHDEMLLALHRIKLKDIEHRWLNVLDQLDDDDVNWRMNEMSNSIANIVIHVVGNLRQRFVAGIEGGKDIRQRDEEFNIRRAFTCAELRDMFTEQFAIVHRVMRDITPDMLTQVYKIQGRDMAVLDVIFGVATHVSEHLGQVLYIAKMRLGEHYQIQVLPHKRR